VKSPSCLRLDQSQQGGDFFMQENMQRGWKKDEFSSPDVVWLLDLDGQVIEIVKGKSRVINVSGAGVKLVYLYLVRCLDVDQRVMPSHKTIAKHTQLSRSTVKRCLQVLANYGLIEIINRFKEGTKENDTNYYIVYHPNQVKGLKRLPSDDASTSEGESIMNQGGFTMNQGGFTMNQGGFTMNQGGFTMNQGGFTMNQGGGFTMNQKNISSSSSSFSSSVVRPSVEAEFNKLNQAWQRCFKQEIDKAAFVTLTKYADVDFLVDVVDKIKKHHKKRIDSPFGFVFSCIEKGGYIVEQPIEPEEKPAKQGQRKVDKKEKLPQMLRMQMEMEQQEQPQQQTEDTKEVERRIQEKLKKLKQMEFAQ
jgi:hypothetical protein